MSELTRCNYCKYHDIVGPAVKEHKEIELRVDDSNLLPSAAARELYIDGKFQAWFMEIPDSCAC